LRNEKRIVYYAIAYRVANLQCSSTVFGFNYGYLVTYFSAVIEVEVYSYHNVDRKTTITEATETTTEGTV